MLVNPARYSPATAPVIVRHAPAKKRNTSAIAGISSLSAAASGLPQFSDSTFANAAPSASMRSASFSSRYARSFGAVRAQPSNAASAAFTAASIWRARGLRNAGQHLAGGRVQHVLDLAFACDELAVDQELGLHGSASRECCMDSAVRQCALRLLVRPRQVVRQQDRNERHEDHDDRDDVGDGPLARPEQFAVEPDRQRALVPGREQRDDDLVERQREGQHAARQQRRGDLRQQHVAEGLVTARAEVHRGLDPARRDAAQARDDVVVDDDEAERRVTRDDGPEAGLEPDRAHAREQGEAGEDAGQRDRQHEQQRDRLLAAERATGERKCRQRAENDRQQRGRRGDQQREPHRLPDVVAGEGDVEPVQRQPGRRELVRAVLRSERIQRDHPDRARAGTPGRRPPSPS